MTHDERCIFCRIIRGEVPSFRVCEDDRSLAFMDINPANPGHVLVIPKVHAENPVRPRRTLADGDSNRRSKGCPGGAEGFRPYGLNIVQANGPGAAQSVPHFHWHVVPRAKDAGLPMNWPLRPDDAATCFTIRPPRQGRQ